MRPYKTYVIGRELYTYGDGYAHKTTLDTADFVSSVSTLNHTYLLGKHGEVMCGNIDEDGRVSMDDKSREVFDGPFCMMSAMTNKAYLLGMSGGIFEVSGKSKIRQVGNGQYVKIDCGSKFLVAFDHAGNAYKFGSWFDGTHIEQMSLFHKGVVDIACGNFHCILLQENGDAVCYGEKEYLFYPVANVVKIYAYGKSTLLSGHNFSKYFGGKHGK